MVEKPHSRRKFLTYAGAGVVAAAAGIGYLTRDYWSPTVPSSTTTSPTASPPETSTPKPLKATFDYSPKYRYILQDPNQTVEFKNLTEYSGDKPAFEWRINNKSVSQEWDYSTKLEPGKHDVRLTARDGKTSDGYTEDIEVDEYGPDYPERKLNVEIKGIGYLVGVPGWLDPIVPVSRMEEDLSVIRNELGCNGIRIEGSYDEQILECGKIAIKKEFDYISLNPRYIDDGWDQYSTKIKNFAPKAEELRKESEAIILQPATEFCVDSAAVFKRVTYAERAPNLGGDMKVNPNWHNQFMSYLKELIALCREHFHGRVTYNEAWWEFVKWTELDVDIIGSNQWNDPLRTESIEITLRRLMAVGKPVIASEFGSVSYEGACALGGYGWSKTGIYSEDAQAACIEYYLETYNKVRPHGAFLVYFYDPTNPWKSKEQTFSIMKPELSQTVHKLSRKKAFYMYKSYKRVGS